MLIELLLFILMGIAIVCAAIIIISILIYIIEFIFMLAAISPIFLILIFGAVVGIILYLINIFNILG